MFFKLKLCVHFLYFDFILFDISLLFWNVRWEVEVIIRVLSLSTVVRNGGNIQGEGENVILRSSEL